VTKKQMEAKILELEQEIKNLRNDLLALAVRPPQTVGVRYVDPIYVPIPPPIVYPTSAPTINPVPQPAPTAVPSWGGPTVICGDAPNATSTSTTSSARRN
jgi:hypothetical protein